MIRSQALLERARPAKPPKPRRDLEVIQVRTIPAARADELIHVVVAALDPAVHDAGRLAPQDRRGAVAGLPGKRGPGDTVEPGKHPRVTAITEVWCGDGRRTGNRSSTGYDVRGAKTAHSTHHQVVVSSRHRGLEQRHCLRPDASMPSLRSQCQAGPIQPDHLASTLGLPGRSRRRRNVSAVFLRVSGHASQFAGKARSPVHSPRWQTTGCCPWPDRENCWQSCYYRQRVRHATCCPRSRPGPRYWTGGARAGFRDPHQTSLSPDQRHDPHRRSPTGTHVRPRVYGRARGGGRTPCGVPEVCVACELQR